MPAKVVNLKLNAGVWIKAKPPEFKGKDLELALKGVEGIDVKNVALPDFKSKAPKLKIYEIEDCIKEMESDLAALKKALAEMNKFLTALRAVQSAAEKTKDELEKMAKDQKASEDQKEKYKSAAQTASAILGDALVMQGSLFQ
jgi:hypothetical protein